MPPPFLASATAVVAFVSTLFGAACFVSAWHLACAYTGGTTQHKARYAVTLPQCMNVRDRPWLGVLSSGATHFWGLGMLEVVCAYSMCHAACR